MNLVPLYVHGESWVHRLSAGFKLSILAIAGTCLFFIDSPWILAWCIFGLSLLFRCLDVGFRTAFKQLLPMIWLLLFVFAGHALLTSWQSGLTVVLRLTTLFLLAVLFTMTTPTTKIISAITWLLRPFSRFGLPVESIAMMLSLTLRYIPLIFSLYNELREAQIARGVRSGYFSILVPLLVKSLKLADQLGEAIDARGFNTSVNIHPPNSQKLRAKVE